MSISFLFSHPSHQLTSFPLAHKLVRSGHQVTYIGPKSGAENEDLVSIVVDNGFEFRELDIYSLKDKELNPENLSSFERFLINISDIHIYEQFFGDNKFGLVILDIFYMPIAIPLGSLGINFVLASTILLSDQDELVPPLDMYHIPPAILSLLALFECL